MEQKNTFEYSYSSKKQEEIEKIRNKYMVQEENRLDQLRKMDREVERPGTIASIAIGVIGTLIMGSGISICLVGARTYLALGIIIGFIGMAVLGTAYPIYKSITKKQKEKLGPRILALSEELMKN